MSRYSHIINKLSQSIDLGWKYKNRNDKWVYVGENKDKIPDYAKDTVKKTREKKTKSSGESKLTVTSVTKIPSPIVVDRPKGVAIDTSLPKFTRRKIYCSDYYQEGDYVKGFAQAHRDPKSNRCFYYPDEVKFRKYETETYNSIRDLQISEAAFGDESLTGTLRQYAGEYDPIIGYIKNLGYAGNLKLKFIPPEQFDRIFKKMKGEGSIVDREGKLVAVGYGDLIIKKDDHDADPHQKNLATAAITDHILFKNSGINDKKVRSLFVQDIAEEAIKTFGEFKSSEDIDIGKIAPAPFKSVIAHSISEKEFYAMFPDKDSFLKEMLKHQDKAAFIADTLIDLYGGEWNDNGSVKDHRDDLIKELSGEYLFENLEDDRDKTPWLDFLGRKMGGSGLFPRPPLNFKNKVECISDFLEYKMETHIRDDGSVYYSTGYGPVQNVEVRHISDTSMRSSLSEKLDIWLNENHLEDPFAPREDGKTAADIAVEQDPSLDKDIIKKNIDLFQFGEGYNSLFNTFISNLPDKQIQPVDYGGYSLSYNKKGNPVIFVDDNFINENRISQRGILGDALGQLYQNNLAERGLTKNFAKEFGYFIGAKSPAHRTSNDEDLEEARMLLMTPDGKPRSYISGDLISTKQIATMYDLARDVSQMPKSYVDWEKFKESIEYKKAKIDAQRSELYVGSFVKKNMVRKKYDDLTPELKKEYDDIVAQYKESKKKYRQADGKLSSLWNTYILQDKENHDWKSQQLTDHLQSLFWFSSDAKFEVMATTHDWDLPRDVDGNKTHQDMTVLHQKDEDELQNVVIPKVTDWLQKHVDEKVWKGVIPHICLTEKRRAYFSGEWEYRKGGSTPQKWIALDSLADTINISTFVHEYGHALEDSYPKVRELLLGFRDARTIGEEKEPLNKILPGHNYADHEEVKKDHFPSPYCGKIYFDGNTELLSMGLQYMFNDPVNFLKSDPEYFQIIYDIMRGMYV